MRRAGGPVPRLRMLIRIIAPAFFLSAIAVPSVDVSAGAGAEPGPGSSAEPDTVLAAWADSIDALRLRRDYEPALALARRLLEARRLNPSTRAFQLRDAESTVQVLGRITALPSSDQARIGLADSLFQAGAAEMEQGRYNEAADLTQSALGIFQRLFGTEDPNVADALDQLGAIRLYDNDPTSADSLFREVLSIRTELLGPEHPDLATVLANQAQVAQSLGDEAGAEHLTRSAITILKRVGADEEPEYALLLNNLAATLLSRGDYAAADPMLRESLVRLRRLLGPESPEVAMLTANLASLQRKMGREPQAGVLYKEALAIQEKALPGDHPNTALFLGNLSVLLERTGDYPAAEDAARRALDMQVSLLGEEDPDVAVSAIALGRVLLASGKADEAEASFRQALRTCEKAGRSSHPDAAAALHGLGMSLCASSKYAEAEQALREATSMRTRLLGQQHPHTVDSMFRLALCLWDRGDLAGADSLLTIAADGYEIARMRAGSGMERALFMTSPYPYLAVLRLERGRTETAWEFAERDLARVLAELLRATGKENLTAAERATSDSLKTALGLAQDRLLAYEEAARTDTSRAAGGQADEARNALLDLEARWGAFHQEMRSSHPEEAGGISSLARVQQSIPARTAIIGWCDAGMSGGEIASWAYVIRRSGPVKWARMGSKESPPHGSWPAFRAAITTPGSPDAVVRRLDQEIHRERLQPLAGFLDGIDALVVIPSGAMRSIPLEVIEDAQGVRLGDRYAIGYVPSASVYSWLAEKRATKAGKTRMLLLGDPPFNESQLVEMGSEATSTEVPGESGSRSPEGERTRVNRGSGTNPGALEALRGLPRLSATRREILDLASTHPGNRVLLGPDASEKTLVELADADSLASFAMLHLATHALVDDRHPENSALVLSQVGLPDPVSAALRGERILDGLLTAKEIIRDWRLDADLVTLSACETGLGQEVQGEGTIGLANAFFQAGARNLLVSLWKVEDQATALLMQRFYQNLLGSTSPEATGGAAGGEASGGRTGRAVALRAAKAWLRDYTNEQGDRPYRHPYYWSAFISIGDPE